VVRLIWRWVRIPFWLVAGTALGFLGPYLIYLDTQVRARFDDLSWDLPSRVYARPLELKVGTPMNPKALAIELDAARYTKASDAKLPGTFASNGDRFVVARRSFADAEGREPAKRFTVTMTNGAVASLVDDHNAPLDRARLDPARIATLYGAEQEERRVVKLEQLPPLMVAGLQAVEDRDFKHHHGINVVSILRAMLSNVAAGHVVQGGSTLTQQLVKNLFLDRGQRYSRKINEALISLIIEARYDKKRILEAYMNEVFLGQQGGQAVHGFAAASEFYFGREPRELTTPEIALLVGLVQGPSLYDPRRHKDLATARRDLVLNEFYETGLIDDATLASARAAPLSVLESSGLQSNRAPAFLDFVHAQLERDYASDELQRAGLSIYTTLSPSTQALAEQAMAQTLDALGKKQPELQGALVVTGVHDGEVQALIGARDANDPGFDRALEAKRPIGSLIKPFVYLVALAQPQTYSLATLLDDSTVDLVQPNGQHWTPQNDDHETHGRVPMIDALAHSYNLATVHLGMSLGVEKVRGLLQSFGMNEDINPNPSLLLGAVDLSPVEVAQMYQYFAADGHAVPLRSVRGVLDAQGKPLKQYTVKSGAGDYVAPARLVTYAMQAVTTIGTAHAISERGLGTLHAAGKTGTSDSQRDSWFAGFTGSQLAVVWIGRDDNKPNGLWGATGALQAWIALFQNLPTSALQASSDGLETAWIDPESGQRTQEKCEGARQMPFIAGHVPSDTEHCVWQEIKSIFGGH
jgi:penicillin-binding protein 1B